MPSKFNGCCSSESNADKYFEDMSIKLKPVVVTFAPQRTLNLDGFPSQLTIRDLPSNNYKKALIDVIEKQFKIKKYSIQMSAADSLAKQIYRIKIVGDKVTKEVILKIPPQMHARRLEYNSRWTFMREIQVHDGLLTSFDELQKSKGIIVNENGFQHYAKCYKILKDEHNEGLFLENLSSIGFKMQNRFKDPKLDHAKLLMEVLGKFHALSLAMKDQNIKKFEQYKQFDDIFTNIKNNEYFSSIMNKSMELLDKNTHNQIVQKLLKLDPTQFLSHLLKCTDGMIESQYSVICHGDCWNNNILYRTQNGKLELRFVDFQVARYASPACDLSYYFFTCTSQDFRIKHYDELLQLYHKSLSDFLTILGSDPEKLFPYCALISEMKRAGKFGYLMACMVLPLMISEPNKIPDLDALAEGKMNGENIKPNVGLTKDSNLAYITRMTGILEDMEKYGYL